MAEKLIITEAKDKLIKIKLAIKQLAETRSKSKSTLDKLTLLREVKSNLTKLIREAGEKTVFIKTKKGEKVTMDYKNVQDLKNVADNSDIAGMKTASGDFQKGNISEEKREYTAEESQAVGEALSKPLEVAIRSTKGELPTSPEVTGHVNGFSIHAIYGRDKGEDTFKFVLNPDDSKIYLKSGREEKEVAPFEVTQANQVLINPEVNLEEVLKDLMTKYTSEPTDQDYDAQAEMEPPYDESQINKFIAERKLALRESLGKDTSVGAYVKDFEKSNAPQFKGKSKEKRAQMGVAAALQAKDKTMKEDLDIGHEDNEPNMLKGDLYKLLRNAADLYKAMQALEGQGEVDFPQWWQGKIMRASDDIECAKEYLEFEMEEPAIDAAVNTLGQETVNEIVFDIKGLGTYRSTKQDADTITGVDDAGTVKTFSKRKIALDNPGIFDKQPREKKEREKKPQGVRPYTEAQYRKVLQGAIDDAGSTKFAYDIADSMILDNQILARLAKDYPEASARELKQRLQWDLEACDSPEDDYDDSQENYDN